ncbi:MULTISPECIES: DUF4870 domain-containing protein [Leeuwenhoekiella]|uniref:Chloroplast import component protein (Tic20) n=1 Tax=Leeuwenhoekiella blandensis (strain CECT 7118 / CCUG 51940 / KCTC 22103 / MED217) TaxID=398720 RepID=A3XLZ8_LEEBM|nr:MULTISPECIES: membrane protein [Leeuwenhoekiella]EAQ49428.1 hypothetical protein MED217_11254 [Leeuwenhoekiella blandensis MED217]MAO44308.1 hypothetical protein [Leeuwenhoekiella sp.]HCW64511.1 hypothetical protein [Leeuwenhoekiella sp.]|tara:strand:+ start:137 stop:466 length:330 start_codon:yes stop_codon:yes gene_type:complete
MTLEDVKQGKTTAIVSYLTMLGTIIAIFMNMEPKNSFARFHIRQAFGVFLTFFALGFLVSYLNSWPASIGFYVFIFILWGYGFVNAVQGNIVPVPILGKWYQKWFTFIE